MSLKNLPKSIPFLIFSEFCERFSYQGLRAIMSIYVTEQLLFSETLAKIVYHTFAMCVYLTAIFGAIIADSFYGKFKVILWSSLVYIAGNMIVTLSATQPCNLAPSRFFLIGIALIAIGSGGLKPCVSAFGGDQFKLPAEKGEMKIYFQIFYFVINAASVLSTFIAPFLRSNVYCFKKASCYPLPFFVSAMLMVASVIVFVVAKPLYTIRVPGENVTMQVIRCIACAIRNKSQNRDVVKKHWLDFAIEEYGKKMVKDIKIVLKIIVLYIPITLFWALFEQLATSWIFQARRMDGTIGKYNILPDQFAIVNPLAILVMIPLFNYAIYPVLTKFGLLKKPLKRMAVGGILTAVAYFISGVLSMQIESEALPVPTDRYSYQIWNVLPCNMTVTLKINLGHYVTHQYLLPFDEMHGDVWLDKYTQVSLWTSNVRGDCPVNKHTSFVNASLKATVSYYYFTKDDDAHPKRVVDDLSRSRLGNPKVKAIVNVVGLTESDMIELNTSITFYYALSNLWIHRSLTNLHLFEVPSGTYDITLGNLTTKQIFRSGGVYNFLAILKSTKEWDVKNVAVVKPFSLHMFLMLPQYIFITAGEVMLSVTGLEFSYSQAPRKMKSFLQACWLLTFALGQLIVIILEALPILGNPSSMFLLYGVIMLVDVGVFMIISSEYQYVTEE